MTDKEKYDAIRYSFECVQRNYQKAEEALDALESSLLTFNYTLKTYFPEVND